MIAEPQRRVTLAEYLELERSSEEKHEHLDGVSPEAFDELAEKAELAEGLRRIDRGMKDVQAGRGRPLMEAVREIADELGLKLAR